MSTPVELEIILFHYYSPAGERSLKDSLAYRDAYVKFTRSGLLVIEGDPMYYVITTRGRVFVQALCAIPLPTRYQEWRVCIPDGHVLASEEDK